MRELLVRAAMRAVQPWGHRRVARKLLCGTAASHRLCARAPFGVLMLSLLPLSGCEGPPAPPLPEAPAEIPESAEVDMAARQQPREIPGANCLPGGAWRRRRSKIGGLPCIRE